MKRERLKAVSERRVYDDIVVTAGNRSQAAGYEAEIAVRQREGRLPAGTVFHVMADPGDRRVGSGAATLVVLERLAKVYKSTPEKLAARRRVLILHSGGDSRRLPAYAAHGKLFLPLPRCDERGRGVSLFDLLIADLSTLVLGGAGRVVVAAGDVYLSLASQRLDLTGADVVGVALRGTTAAGSLHGVYVAGSEGRVTGFLQKPSEELAREAGAVGADGRLLLDTGVVSLSARAVGGLARAARVGGAESLLAGVLAGRLGALDFYEHLLIGLFVLQSAAQYAGTLAAPRSEAFGRLRVFKEALPRVTARVVTATESKFLHIGTTRELLERLGPGFGDGAAGTRRVVFNSLVSQTLVARGKAVVEGSVLRREWKLGGDNVVVGVPSAFDRRVVLPRGVGVVFLPVGRKDWAVVVFGDRDDFKTPFAAGAGSGGTFLNRRVRSARVDGKTLWDVPLWRVGTLSEAYEHAMRLLKRPGDVEGGAGLRSVGQVIAAVNHRRLQAERLEVERLSRLGSLAERMRANEWLAASQAAADVRTKGEAAAAVADLEQLAAIASSHRLAARALYLRARVLERHGSARGAEGAMERTFARVGESVSHGVEPVVFPRSPGIMPDQVVWARCPARLDLAGGWTDTPPVCTDIGGAVVNAAVSLNGQFPLQAACRLTPEPTIRLSSIDLGRAVTYRTTRELLSVGDLGDWDALPKAALLLTGFVPRGGGVTLARHLERFGAGLDVTLYSALPKGSGLGSSSILGATLIAALLRVLDPAGSSARRVIELTSQLEQLMSSGGGWQDQAGGVMPGVKLVTSRPGPDQSLTIDTLAEGGLLGKPEAASRCLLYYTGQRRLAKNILRNVVGGYLGREAGVREVIERLKAGACSLHSVLSGARKGTLDDAAGIVSEYWSLKKRLDPGATNAGIERLFGLVERELSGGTILGAGGGGFALLIARDERAAESIRRKLASPRASPLARFYDFAVDQRGLSVSVV